MMHVPFVLRKVVVEAGLDVLQLVEDGEHVDEVSKRELGGLRDEALQALRVGQGAHRCGEALNGLPLEGVKVLELLDLGLEHLHGGLVNFVAVGLLAALDLRHCARAAAPRVQHRRVVVALDENVVLRVG